MEKSGLKNVKLADIRPYANSEDYQKFLDKFKPVYTTDDCFTPPEVYEAVRKWVLAHYGIPEDREIVRPFYTGGDYEHYEYPDGCLVLDNPPFSMLSNILKFYRGKGIDFFLFCDSRYLANYQKASNAVACSYSIRYENGALINTSYLTIILPSRTSTVIAESRRTSPSRIDFARRLISSFCMSLFIGRAPYAGSYPFVLI